jgi:hypothetical protein
VPADAAESQARYDLGVNDSTRGPSEPTSTGEGQRLPWNAPRDEQSLWDMRGQPPIEDPFLRAPPQPPAKRAPWLAILAVTSTLLFMGTAVAGFLLWRGGHLVQAPAAPAPEPPPIATAPKTIADPPAPPSAIASAPTASAAPDPVPVASVEPSPRRTKAVSVGKIAVVDVGSDSSKSLADVLSEQSVQARAAGQTLVVMTTRFGMKEFRDVDAALAHPLLQTALENVRLVRTDVIIFMEELEELGIPTNRFPGFFLLGPDLVPRDGIDGDEWDDDVPRNIAPVLGAFVRGSYKQRRQTWKPPRGKGVAL